MTIAKRLLLTFAFAFLTSYGVSALTGDIVAVSGKVEFREGQGAWKPLKAGDKLQPGAMISTGFKSETTIRLGASVLTVKPLTRMTLSQLVEREDTVDTELYLEVGNVRAEVKSLNNKKNGFTVKSPIATASVRGTIFDMGDRLVVREGSVICVSAVGQRRIARAGSGSMKLSKDILSSPLAMKLDTMDSIRITGLPSAQSTSLILSGLSLPTTQVTITSGSALALALE